MAQNPRIAKRYAGALLGLAEENGVIDAVQADLKGLSESSVELPMSLLLLLRIRFAFCVSSGKRSSVPFAATRTR